MKKYIVNGVHIVDFRSMCDAFGTAVSAPNGYFGRDLQTFDDCLFDYVAFVKPCEFFFFGIGRSNGLLEKVPDATGQFLTWLLTPGETNNLFFQNEKKRLELQS